MDLNWDTAAIVEDGNFAIFSINCDFDSVHIRVPNFIVRRVDQDFVEDLVQTRDHLDIPRINSKLKSMCTDRPWSLSPNRKPTFAGIGPL